MGLYEPKLNTSKDPYFKFPTPKLNRSQLICFRRKKFEWVDRRLLESMCFLQRKL